MTEPQRPESRTRAYLRANLFDGDEVGTVRVHLESWLGELTDVVDDLIREARAAERTESPRIALLEAVAAAAVRSFRTYDTASDGTQTRITPTEANSRRLDVVYALAALRALASDPPAPVPNPDPALAYAPDGSVIGRVIGWATKPDGRSVPILGPAPEPEPPAQTPGQVDVDRLAR